MGLSQHHKTPPHKWDNQAGRKVGYHEGNRTTAKYGALKLAPESKCLLEINTIELFQSKTVYAVKAARIAEEQALKLSSGTTSNWKEIMKDGKFAKSRPKTPTRR